MSMNLVKKFFAKKKNSKKKAPSAADAIDQLNKNLEALEMREKQLQKKVSAEAEKAKEFAKLKNKNSAIQSLKKKKLYEAQIEQLVNSQLRLHDQVMTLENAKATHDTIDALKSGSSTLQALQQGLSVDEIEKEIGEDTKENFESIKEIQDLLANPVGISAELNEDDLTAELEKLEELVLKEELPATPLHHDRVSLSMDNVNELPASQPTRRKVSRSTSSVVEHSSQLPVTPAARKLFARSITNVGQYPEAVSQSITKVNEFPEVPATPVSRRTVRGSISIT